MMKRAAFALALILLTVLPTVSSAARLKDIADVGGVRGNPLVGYGLVIGLDGTGDSSATKATENALLNMLENMGLTLPPGAIKVGNVASVMVTTELPAFARNGQQLDVLVSSIGNAKSLGGGTLLITPLRGGDGDVYAVAQGPLSVGGFAMTGGGDTVQRNHPTVGKIIAGARVERELPYDMNRMSTLSINLQSPDFSTITRVADAINVELGEACAKAVDGSTVSVDIPPRFRGNVIEMMSIVENVDVAMDRLAKVVVNERTGTIIMGDGVQISQVAISHGNLNIQINERSDVSQPAPLSDGETVVNKNTSIDVFEDNGGMHLIGGGVSIGELVRALNAIGATPRDLISILQAIKEAGALQARLEIL